MYGEEMLNTTWARAISVLGVTLLLSSCAMEPITPDEETAPTEAGHSEGESRAAGAAEVATPPSAEADTPEFAEGPVPAEKALDIFDSPRESTVPAPNGERWPLHGSFDMDVLRQHFDATLHMTTYHRDCTDLDSVHYMWLREDGYSSGGEAGPTCFGEHGGRVDPAELRVLDFVCQAPHTTARTLIVPTVPAEGSNTVSAVFTPEHTSEETWECFDFSGEEVEGDQTVVVREN